MSSAKDENNILKLLFEQSWLHIRHVENHRFWFTNMYLLVMAGVLAYVSSQTPVYGMVVHPVLAIFMIFLACIGLMLSTKVNKVRDAYTKAIDNIINDRLGPVTKYKGYMLVRSEISERWRKAQSVKYLYRALYLMSIVLWVFLLAYFLYIGIVSYITNPLQDCASVVLFLT